MTFTIYNYILLGLLLVQLCSSRGASATETYHWGSWSLPPLSCSVTCGRGVRCSLRLCLDHNGVVQPTPDSCIADDPTGLGDRMCTSCVHFLRCPRQPGWGLWSLWSACQADSANPRHADDGCTYGRRVRTRACDNPPPEPPPQGLPCVGPTTETSDCPITCDPVMVKNDQVASEIGRRVLLDHRRPSGDRVHVVRRDKGREVRLDCTVPAYRLAKKLTVSGTRSAVRRAFAEHLVKLKWYKNGERFKPIYKQDCSKATSANPDARTKQKRRLLEDPEIEEELFKEEIRWQNSWSSSPSYFDKTVLVISSVTEGDQGFYTCEIVYSSHNWMASFFSVIVVDHRLTGEATRPFFLHSNLGLANALRKGPTWMESSQLSWHLNGRRMFRGLAIRPDRRIQRIDYLNMSHQGTWKCFLIIPAYGQAYKTVKPQPSIIGVYLLSEFKLDVNHAPSTTWHLAERPESIRLLRNVCTVFIALCALLFIAFWLSVWASYRWIRRVLNVDQIRAILQEIVDDAYRLIITGHKRAEVAKDKLLPLIDQQHQELGRTRTILTQRWSRLEDTHEEALTNASENTSNVGNS